MRISPRVPWNKFKVNDVITCAADGWPLPSITWLDVPVNGPTPPMPPAALASSQLTLDKAWLGARQHHVTCTANNAPLAADGSTRPASGYSSIVFSVCTCELDLITSTLTLTLYSA